MREVTTQVELVIDASAHRIWAYRLDFLHLPEYKRLGRGMERVDAGDGAGVGATYRFDLVTEPTAVRSSCGSPVRVRCVGGHRHGWGSTARERFTVSPSAVPAPTTDRVCVHRPHLFVPDHSRRRATPSWPQRGRPDAERAGPHG